MTKVLTKIEHFADLIKGTTLRFGTRTVTLSSYPSIKASGGVIESIKLSLCDDEGEFDTVEIQRNCVHKLPKFEIHNN